nr:MAG TPA: hypothetical protein [Caudoviricetes sp.]
MGSLAQLIFLKTLQKKGQSKVTILQIFHFLIVQKLIETPYQYRSQNPITIFGE